MTFEQKICRFLIAGIFAFFLPLTAFAQEEKEEQESVSPFLNPRTVEKRESTTLPVSLDEVAKFLDDTDIRMPQSGDHLGIITRETTVYDKRASVSMVYPIETIVTTKEGEPYMGTISSPLKLFRSELPQPGIDKTSYLGGIFLQTEEHVTFDPPAILRLPLKEQQYNNEDITAYFFSPDTMKYENADAYLTEDGKGVYVPIVRNGYYGIFTSAGELPDSSNNNDNEEDEEEEIDLDILPGKEEREFVVSNQYVDISTHWAKDYIQELSNVGIATGKSPIVFGPDEPATRGEIIKMIIDKEFQREETNECLSVYMPSEYTTVFFTDVPQSHPHAKYICMAAVHKKTKGLQDGTFAPDRPVSRAEALKLLYEVEGTEYASDAATSPFADVSSADWFSAPVLHAVQNGITQGFSEYTGDKIRISAERLHRGDISGHVKNLQQILTNLQFYTGAIDGNLDPEVSESVMQYQLSRGIINTPTDVSAGVVGPSTITRLNEESGAIATPENTITVFKPHQPVTRAELAKFAAMIFGLTEE